MKTQDKVALAIVLIAAVLSIWLGLPEPDPYGIDEYHPPGRY